MLQRVGLTPGLLIVLTALGFFPAFAQTTEVSIRDLPRMEGFTLSGIVVAIKGNTFVLDDGTGVIIVEAGPPWWQQLDLQLNEQVTVVGRPAMGGFEAFSITRADGTVTDVRSGEGPPPWAGGPFRQQGAAFPSRGD